MRLLSQEKGKGGRAEKEMKEGQCRTSPGGVKSQWTQPYRGPPKHRILLIT